MNMKRMRGRGHRQGGGGGSGFRNQQNGIPLNRNHVFDSSGPEMRVRGTAQQLYDKYTQLARDAASGGDRVLGEAYYQHAEHYFRIISAINQAQGLPPPGQGGQPQGGEFQRREPAEGGEAQGEHREQQPRQENRQEGRQDNREHRQQQERRFEPRQQRQEFQPRERNEQRGERQFRPAAPIAETPIDISSALEAELQAAAAAPAGLGEQPNVQAELPVVQAELPIVPEPRAIPIIPDAPPAPVEAVAEGEPAATPAPRRPRGRPRTKPVAAEAEKVSE
jgi:hypothetical protein